MSDEIAEILDSIDMEAYLDREGIEYKVTPGSSGTQLQVKDCPVCGSSKWKVYLNADTGLGNCFAGDHPPGENFSKWNFIAAHIGSESARQTVEHLKTAAREMGWRARRKVSVDVNLNTDLVLPESFEIPINGKNVRYLSERNIDVDTAKYFHLRYSQNGRFWYRYNGEVKCQNYAKRIIIPIFNIDGELVSFQGRDITGKAEKKYLFPPGFSSTGKYLYNAQNVISSKTVIVGEGVFDVMAIKCAIDPVVDLRFATPIGTFGKHLSHFNDGSDQLGEFLKLKARGVEEVVFMWDSEPPAINAAIEAALIVKRIGLKTRVAILPDGKDPNEIPPNAVIDAYWNAVPITNSSAIKMKMKHCRGLK